MTKAHSAGFTRHETTKISGTPLANQRKRRESKRRHCSLETTTIVAFFSKEKQHFRTPSSNPL
jgi:hypothetical protein